MYINVSPDKLQRCGLWRREAPFSRSVFIFTSFKMQ